MILNPGELVVSGKENYEELRQIIIDAGYRMYYGGIIPNLHDHIGLRYHPDNKYPKCIVCVSESQLRAVQEGRPLDIDCQYSIISMEEMLSRMGICTPVADLL